MPNAEKKKFNKRFSDIIPDSAQQYVREYDDQFLEAAVEILGWGWLKDRYPSNAPQFTLGTPDLLVKNNSGQVIAAMECKHKRHSEFEANWLQHPQNKIITGTVDDRLISSDYNANPFLRNLVDTLCKAEKQLNETKDSHKFIFLNLSFDTQVSALDEQKRGVVCLISRLEAELCQRGIALVSFEQFQVDRLITGAGLPNSTQNI